MKATILSHWLVHYFGNVTINSGLADIPLIGGVEFSQCIATGQSAQVAADLRAATNTAVGTMMWPLEIGRYLNRGRFDLSPFRSRHLLFRLRFLGQ